MRMIIAIELTTHECHIHPNCASKYQWVEAGRILEKIASDVKTGKFVDIGVYGLSAVNGVLEVTDDHVDPD